jgi:hypothetical protein
MSRTAAEKADILKRAAVAKGEETVDLLLSLRREDYDWFQAGMTQRLEVEAEELKQLIAETYHVSLQKVERLITFMAENIRPDDSTVPDFIRGGIAASALVTMPAEKVREMLASLSPDEPRAG